MILLALMWVCLHAMPAFAQGDTTLAPSAFQLRLDAVTIHDTPCYRVRMEMLPNALIGIEGIAGRLCLQHPSRIVIAIKSVVSALDGVDTSIVVSDNGVYLNFHCWSLDGWNDDDGLWLEWVFVPLGGEDLSQASVALDGIVEVDLIEGMRRKHVDDVDSLENKVTVFPNPASDHVCIRFADDDQLIDEVTLVSVMGHVECKVPVANGQAILDLEVLPSGLYSLVYYCRGVRKGSVDFLKR